MNPDRAVVEHVGKLRQTEKQAQEENQMLRGELKWIAQTVHQGYHDRSDRTWQDCEMALCEHITKLTAP